MIWMAYNGWRGNGEVAVIVEAETEAEARKAASEALREQEGEQFADVVDIEQLKLPWIGEIS